MPRTYNTHGMPKGRARLRGTQPVTADMRKRAERSSFAGTCKLRAKLDKVDVVYHDSSWCHMQDGSVLARFSDVGAAVAAL